MSSLAPFWCLLVFVLAVSSQVTRSWDAAKALASSTVSALTLREKVSLVHGVGNFNGLCVGNTYAISRLNIPSICMNDGPAGLREVDLVSGFPAGINAAATWNKALMQQRGEAIGEEFRTKGAHVFLGPAMDVTRAPEAGRQWESFGVDSYLTGEAACAKHFIGNQQESFRYSESSVIDQRTLQEKYVYPFRRAVDAGVACVMCSYNRVNGTYACENPALIGETGLLKGQLGFKGYVVSDWGATHGSAIGQQMPGDWILRFPTTNFNVQSSSSNSHVNARTAAHTALIRTIGGASAVLLKNLNNALPLVSSENIAVVGLDAGPNAGCTLNACDAGTLSVGWGSGTNSLAYLVPPVTAIQAQVNATIAAGHATILTTSISNDLAAAMTAADGADVALIVVIHSVGPVILEAWIDNPNVTAVINAGLPGEQSGSSIVDVLWGIVNPSGRLPYSIAKSASDYPAHTLSFDVNLFPDITYSEGLFTDYMYFDAQNVTPRYEFGYGLSYSFSTIYSNLVITSSSSTSHTVTLVVQNAGTRAGTEIVQLYIGFPPAAGEPPKLLRGFEAVDLAPGVQSIVTFPLVEKDISVWSSDVGNLQVYPGTFAVYVGSSSRDIRLTGGFTV
ncbi:glycoside hydrolase family 3 protein [Hydnum rufescens UP504]|uniref:beta-glucosidase n=1 Tax=Hydnum rufescens UP504 TaxID=1448309 RepID=A0A9P6DVU0_9AGAM|nr:glycoside hydrolase family 3 protein [Hydnum rufescens UP504]